MSGNGGAGSVGGVGGVIRSGGMESVSNVSGVSKNRLRRLRSRRRKAALAGERKIGGGECNGDSVVKYDGVGTLPAPEARGSVCISSIVLHGQCWQLQRQWRAAERSDWRRQCWRLALLYIMLH